MRIRKFLYTAGIIAGLTATPVMAANSNSSEITQIERIDASQSNTENMAESNAESIAESGVESMVEDVTVVGEADENRIAFDDIGISAVADDYIYVRQEDDGFAYIYTRFDESMPYIILGKYEMSLEGFVDKFTEYMTEHYDEISITAQENGKTLAGRTFDVVTYEYKVTGYTVKDTRMFTELGGAVYMIGAKEVPELEYTNPPNYLEKVAVSTELLDGGEENYSKHISEGSVLFGHAEEE